MQSFRRYNLLLAALLGPVVALMLVASFFLQPYDGDLTRIGGFPETRYGWQAPQKRFVPPLYHLHDSGDATLAESAEIIVIGDSFSHRADVSWPNYLAQATGLRVHVFKSGKMTPDQLLQSETFRHNPPRVMIWQIVERNLINRRSADNVSCRVGAAPVAAQIPAHSLSVTAQTFQREVRAAAFDLSIAADSLTKILPRELIGYNWTRARRLALTHEAPFSSTERRQLLVYLNDIKKSGRTDADWESARCRLIELQNRVQANGQTYFIAMIAPDKLSAYDDFLVDRSLAGLSHIDRLARDPALHLPRIDLALRRAIRDGVTDVYLSNDTHWGSAGYAVAARAVVEQLMRAGVLAPAIDR